MAQRRPITTHPAFVPLLSLWFAALLGLGVAVLPANVLAQALGSVGADALLPLTTAGRMAASAAAAALGALIGLAVARPLARRGAGDPRPIYAEDEADYDHPVAAEPARRPLRVREDLLDEAPAVPMGAVVEAEWSTAPTPAPHAGGEGEARVAELPEPTGVESTEGFMILTPQPVHPPRPVPDLDALVAQFDAALAAFRSGEEARPARAAGNSDPVHAFVARQTGASPPSPLGGRMPDHQAELRAALDKLARANRKD